MRDWFAKIALILAFAAPAAAPLLIPGLSLQGRIIAYASLFLLLVPIALVALRHVPPPTVVPESGCGARHELGRQSSRDTLCQHGWFPGNACTNNQKTTPM